MFNRRRALVEARRLNLNRIEFLMKYLEEHFFKDKKDVVEALNRDLLLDIPVDIDDPEECDWPDPTNKNLAISFYCTDHYHPSPVGQFGITGFEELANTLILGTASEKGGKVAWTIDVSKSRPVPKLAAAVQEAFWRMPGWELGGFDEFPNLQRK